MLFITNVLREHPLIIKEEGPEFRSKLQKHVQPYNEHNMLNNNSLVTSVNL